ncbi:signal peptidase II [Halomonas sp. G15]|uniref:signal peptidase II n=1 Tax=Halomonas sp. G15 TaxID=2903521 RepID=UPI003FA56373
MLIIGKKLSPYALLSISGLLAASDQAVKWLVQQSMAYGEYVSVTPFFNWVHLWNTGAAFSLFANGGGWQRYFFRVSGLSGWYAREKGGRQTQPTTD